ncbi:MAG: leucyl aminopeptidase [Desulfovibrionaceae bacterium]|nr:leucyl aminopeptidase [Desulfovibrionaceae bacterium]
MKINVSTHADAQVLILPLFENESLLSPSRKALLPWLEQSSASECPSLGKKGRVMLLYAPAGYSGIGVALVMGLGRRDEKASEEDRLSLVRNLSGRAMRKCREFGLSSVALSLKDIREIIGREGKLVCAVRESACAAGLGLYRNLRFKSDAEKADSDPEQLLFLVDSDTDLALQKAAKEGEIAAEAVLLARELVNCPASHLAPEDMAREAERLASSAVRCEILNGDDLRREEMNAFLSVSSGSSHDPRLIVLEYAPHGHEDDDPFVIVGKGLTFDSGGISLKPSAGMWEMKGDMAGAASVLGIFSALEKLGIQRRVIGLAGCAENMPDALATRPGDVVRTKSGKTVEIVNTDAEGRMVLCDVLSYAQKRWHPSFLVDIATLTGACVVALGPVVAGVFSRSGAVAEKIRLAGRMVGEEFWPMPVHERYMESLKSETADFANAGSREGGACAAAAFLSQFVDSDTDWAHLDIAGPGFLTKAVDNCPAGGSGFSVRTILELLR